MPQESIGRSITLISRHLQTVINKRLEDAHCTTSQLPFLLAIARHDGLSQDELSDMAQVDKITTSKMVKRLIAEGYVNKVQDSCDRRIVRLSLTEQGRAAAPQIHQIFVETTALLASGFTPEEEQQVRTLLARMLSNIARAIEIMKADQLFQAKLNDVKAELAALPDIPDAACVYQTAARLESLHATPTLIMPVARFFYCSKAELLAEIDRVAVLTDDGLRAQGVEIRQDAQAIKLEQISLLAYHFKLLTRLRQDEAHAWDEIDEMYGDD